MRRLIAATTMVLLGTQVVPGTNSAQVTIAARP
jgi:hypothetical protein